MALSCRIGREGIPPLRGWPENGGGAWGRSRWDFDDGSTDWFRANGALFGGTVGFNWQNGRLVTGIEGTFDWTNLRGSTDWNCSIGCRTSNSFLGTVDGRVGYGVGNLLPFVMGGLAFGNVDLNLGGVSVNSDTRVGWNVGVGVEYKFAPGWSAKAQYNYLDLGGGSCGPACGDAKVPLRENWLLFGVNRALGSGN